MFDREDFTDVEVKAVTKGPLFHWFGYYDKQQFDHSGRFLLGMEADFEHRPPEPADIIRIGMVDLQDNNRWIELDKSGAWCWQAGCMLQWRPGSQSEIIWNDRVDNQFVSHILDINSGKKRTLPFPFFTIHPEGRTALGLDFDRLNDMRPGYGYAGIQDRNIGLAAPEDAGIYLLDLEAGKSRLFISIASAARIPHPSRDLTGCKHYFHCLLFNSSGSRFVFLHRWLPDMGRGWPFKTRMISSDIQSGKLTVLVPWGCGHFNWRDNEQLIVQEKGFFLYADKIGQVGEVGRGVLPLSGGHVSYLPGQEWLVGDTYPDEKGNQHLYLYNIPNGDIIYLGRFYSPQEYSVAPQNGDAQWRCDLHPRISRDGSLVSIDSPHGGNGRQIYVIDISEIINRFRS